MSYYVKQDFEKSEKSVTRMWTVLVLTLFSIATLVVTYLIVNQQGATTEKSIGVVGKKVDSVIVKQTAMEQSLTQIQTKQQESEDNLTDSLVLILRRLNLTLSTTSLNKRATDSIRTEIFALESLLNKNDTLQ
jgi:hypothetical protein